MAPGAANPLQSRGDIDAVAHQVAVAFLDDVADVNADAEFDSPVLRHAGVALDEAVLDFDRAADRVHDAAKLDDTAVAGAFDDAAMMSGDGWIDEIAAGVPSGGKCSDPRRRRPAGYNRRHPQPGSPRAFGSRSLRPSWGATLAQTPAPVCRFLGAKDRLYAAFLPYRLPSEKGSKGSRAVGRWANSDRRKGGEAVCRVREDKYLLLRHSRHSAQGALLVRPGEQAVATTSATRIAARLPP